MSKVKKKNAPLSEYEKLRLRNIEEREELFKEVLEAKNLVNRAFRKRKPVSKPKEPLPPRNKSRRIAAAERGEVVVKYKEDFELRTLLPEEIYHPQLKLKLKDSFEEKVDLSKKLFSSIADEIKGQGKKLKPSNKNQFIQRLDRYNSKFYGSKMEDAVCCSIHPTNHMILGCAGSKDGKIFFGKLNLGQVSDKLNKLEDYDCFIPHTGKIFHQTWDIFDDEKTITSSEDGTIRIFDIRSLQSSLLFGEQKFMDANGSCFYHAQIDRDTYLISKGIGTKGKIGLIDIRSGVIPVQEFHYSNNVSDMKSLDVHPLKRFQYLAADGNGKIRLFDTRHVKEVRTRKETVCKGVPLATFLNDEQDVYSFAHWSPITGNKVIVSNPFEMKLYSYNSCSDRIPVYDQVNFRLRKDHDSRAQGMGHWHPKYDDVYMKLDWKTNLLSTWIVETKGNTDSSFKWMHGMNRTGRSMENFAIHPTLDAIIGFGFQGRMTLLEYDDTESTENYGETYTKEEIILID